MPVKNSRTGNGQSFSAFEFFTEMSKFRTIAGSPGNIELAMLQISRAECRRMSGAVKDLESVNDNLSVEQKLEIVRTWAKQSGYLVVADAVEHALIELQRRAK